MIPREDSAEYKMFDTPHKKVKVNGEWLHIIPDDNFTAAEIEELREGDKHYLIDNGRHLYANFLPDDIRPPEVKKL